jgi:hypothetical protein
MSELVEKLRQAKILRKAMNATVMVNAKDKNPEESARKRSISSGVVNMNLE